MFFRYTYDIYCRKELYIMSIEQNHVKGKEYWIVIKNIRGFKNKINKTWKEIVKPDFNRTESESISKSPFPSIPNITKYVGLYKEKQKTQNSEPKTMTLDFVKAATNMINYYIEPPINYTNLYEKEINWNEKILINTERSFNTGAIAGISGVYYGYTLNDTKEGRLTGNYLKIYPQKNASFKTFFVNRIETEEIMEELLNELKDTDKIDETINKYKVFSLRHNDIPSRFYIGKAIINKYSLEIDLSLEGKKNSFTKIILPIRLYAQNGNAGALYLGGVGMKISGLGFENYSLKVQRIALLRCKPSPIPQETFSLNHPLIFPFLIGNSSETKICVDEQEDRDFYTSVIIGPGDNYNHINGITDSPESLKIKIKRYIDYLEVAQRKAAEIYALCDHL